MFCLASLGFGLFDIIMIADNMLTILFVILPIVLHHFIVIIISIAAGVNDSLWNMFRARFFKFVPAKGFVVIVQESLGCWLSLLCVRL
jgi:hypothetical protein